MIISIKKPKLIPLLAFLLTLPLLLKLGFWQLGRAHEKEQLLAERAQGASLPPVALATLDPAKAKAYQRISLSGQFDTKHNFLLDNQTLEGQVGYRVFTPFHLKAGGALLVNRGWVRGNPDRRILPEVRPGSESVTLQGWLVPPPTKAFTLSQRETPSATWPKRVQTIDLAALEKTLGYSLNPYMVILFPHQKFGYATALPPLPMPPRKHYGYAVQWFTMAATLLIIFIALLIQRKPPDYGQQS